MLSEKGVVRVVEGPLTEEERGLLHRSAAVLKSVFGAMG